MIRVAAVQPLHGHSVRVTLTNGEQRDIDVTRYIDHGGIFTSMTILQSFASFAPNLARLPGPTVQTLIPTFFTTISGRTRPRKHGGQREQQRLTS